MLHVPESGLTGEAFLQHSDSPDQVVAIRLNGKIRDLRDTTAEGDALEFVKVDEPDGLEVIRHSTAHLLAHAVRELYGAVALAIGPVVGDEFYYDIHFSGSKPPGVDDLPNIEEKMHTIAARCLPIVRSSMTRPQAVEFFQVRQEWCKLEIIQDIPDESPITVYTQGEFSDLCRGPHVLNTSLLRHFKLLKVSGSYWRGDASGTVLCRIYGTAWDTKEKLSTYLERLELARERDHRKIGKELNLFHLQKEAVGQVFWHPKGYALYRTIEEYVRTVLLQEGYVEVKTPLLLDSALWEQSGHMEKFRDNMIFSEMEDRTLALKPMNCPCHIQIFNQTLVSYAKLPVRMAEFGMCHRYESSGSMHGLMRVQGFVQDDAHIFCMPEQLHDEVVACYQMTQEIYRRFGFQDFKVRYANRPKVSAGTDLQWKHAEAVLEDVLQTLPCPYEYNPGEGAFYGPKLEFVLRDALGREWQCGTVQVDFVLPERLDARYVGEDNQRHTPVLIHRAILGTFERFIGILIEHHAGSFPFWLAPVQVIILTVSDAVVDYARMLQKMYRENGFRVDLDSSNNKIGYKVRLAILEKYPLICVIGKREMLEESVSLRWRSEDQTHRLTVEDSLSQMRRYCEEKKERV